MGSFAGLFQRPVVAAAATFAAAASANVPEKFMKPASPPILQYAAEVSPQTQSVRHNSNSVDYQNIFSVRGSSSPDCQILPQKTYGVMKISDFWITYNSKDYRKFIFSELHSLSSPHFTSSSLRNVIGSIIPSNNLTYEDASLGLRSFHNWHLPKDRASHSSSKPAVAVVLLGWLGSQQRHLKKYADWYTSRGIHAITFTLDLKDIVTYSVGGKAEELIDLLVKHLALWMKEEKESSSEKYIIFHTFSNTGWLTYGAILERLSSFDHALIHKIKGTVVDSAPVAVPDPQVWASGFSAALLKKRSVAVKGMNKDETNQEERRKMHDSRKPRPNTSETALLTLLENFFKFYLKIPSVDRRLSHIIDILSHQQPRCPQLYFYSSADAVIPAESVEEFVEKQKQAGYNVRAFNFIFSPHVDHFRNSPDLYGCELTKFLEDCLPYNETQKEEVVSSS